MSTTLLNTLQQLLQKRRLGRKSAVPLLLHIEQRQQLSTALCTAGAAAVGNGAAHEARGPGSFIEIENAVT
jgi:hypothetical protein